MLFDKIPDDVEKNIMEQLQISLIEQFITAMRDGELKEDDSILTSYLTCIFNFNEQIDLIKAIGLIHFKDNREAQLTVNDFCGVLSDLYNQGKLEMRKR